MLFSLSLISCSKIDPVAQNGTGEFKGSVKDESGNPYPGTLVSISKESEQFSLATGSDGEFQANTESIGTYTLEIGLPLSTQAISLNPATVNVDGTHPSTSFQTFFRTTREKVQSFATYVQALPEKFKVVTTMLLSAASRPFAALIIEKSRMRFNPNTYRQRNHNTIDM
jgi:hypothetical protein